MNVNGYITVVGGIPEIDDIHLIMEYDRDATWGEYATKRANRYSRNFYKVKTIKKVVYHVRYHRINRVHD